MAKPNWPHWEIPGEMHYWTGPNGARYLTPEQAICLSLDIDPNGTFPEHERKRYAERLRELQDAIGWEKPPLIVKDGKVELSDFVLWAHQRPGWDDMPAELFTIAVDEPSPEQGAQSAAEIHENRYRAVGEYAQSASFDVAELDAWAVANRVPGSFRTLLTPDSVGADLPSVRRFQPCSSLPALIASAFVPIDMESHEAQVQLHTAGDTGEYPNPVSRLRDLIMGRYERLLLNAVYDGELDLYDTLTCTKIDVHAARLGYEANPDAYLQAADERVMGAHMSKMAELINNDEGCIDWDYWAGKMPRWTAHQAVRLMAALDPTKHIDLSFRRNETAGAAKEQAKRLEILAASCGMTDATPREWLEWADRMREPVHTGLRAALRKLTATPSVLEEAREILRQKFARLDHLAWAMVILATDAPAPGEARYRQILSMTQWLQSLQLPFRHNNGLPAVTPTGTLMSGMDMRDFQYLAVTDVRAAAIAAHCWPVDELENPSKPPLAVLPTRPVRLPNTSRVNVEWLTREIAFALVEIPADERLATLKKETPDGPGKWRIEPLTGDDWRLVHEICGGKPPAPCSPAQFEVWREKFDAAPNKPDWHLAPEYQPSHAMQKSQAKWAEICSGHVNQIDRMAQEGKLTLITAEGFETASLYDNAGLSVGCLRIADAKAYLNQCSIVWEIVSATSPEPTATKSGKGMTHIKPNWSVWRHMLKASLSDAVCLSCNVNPGAATLNPIQHGIAHLLGLDFVGWDVTRTIAERLSIARSHSGTGGTLPTLTGDKDGEVYLATFAEWAVNTMNWTVPDELRALASGAVPDAASSDVATATEASQPRTETRSDGDAASSDAPWISTARDLALTYIGRHKKQNLFPTQDDVCKHLESELRDAKIYGHHNRPLAKDYIKRNAIQGKWWRANKP
ncbi:hypothetical protein [Burkholderia latens]|uniref:hypothetical protein n=1 Tax=Burkholderia latens TaxID=488446 RepID=UPI0021BBF6CD|nr:hypothetical protein [Burkholderia latens]